MYEAVGRSSRRPFLTSQYLPDDQSVLGARRPIRCPGSAFSILPCRISFNGWRSRKTGPHALLQRVHCSLHKIGFTLYPCGMVPYGRRSFIDAPNFFDAIKDAESSVKWPEIFRREGATFKTQKRHILALTKIFGAEPTQSDAERIQAALTFNIPTIHLIDAACKIREGPTYKGRAQAVMLLLKLPDKDKRLTTILRRGTSLKFWGECIIDERDFVSLYHFSTDDGDPPHLSSH